MGNDDRVRCSDMLWYRTDSRTGGGGDPEFVTYDEARALIASRLPQAEAEGLGSAYIEGRWRGSRWGS